MTSNHMSLLSQLTSSHWAGWVCAAIGLAAIQRDYEALAGALNRRASARG